MQRKELDKVQLESDLSSAEYSDDEVESDATEDEGDVAYEVDAIKYATWMKTPLDVGGGRVKPKWRWHYGVMWKNYLRSLSDSGDQPTENFDPEDDPKDDLVVQFWRSVVESGHAPPQLRLEPGQREPSDPGKSLRYPHRFYCPKGQMRLWLQETNGKRSFATFLTRNQWERDHPDEPIPKRLSDHYVYRRRQKERKALLASGVDGRKFLKGGGIALKAKNERKRPDDYERDGDSTDGDEERKPVQVKKEKGIDRTASLKPKAEGKIWSREPSASSLPSRKGTPQAEKKSTPSRSGSQRPAAQAPAATSKPAPPVTSAPPRPSSAASHSSLDSLFNSDNEEASSRPVMASQSTKRKNRIDSSPSDERNTASAKKAKVNLSVTVDSTKPAKTAPPLPSPPLTAPPPPPGPLFTPPPESPGDSPSFGEPQSGIFDSAPVREAPIREAPTVTSDPASKRPSPPRRPSGLDKVPPKPSAPIVAAPEPTPKSAPPPPPESTAPPPPPPPSIAAPQPPPMSVAAPRPPPASVAAPQPPPAAFAARLPVPPTEPKNTASSLTFRPQSIRPSTGPSQSTKRIPTGPASVRPPAARPQLPAKPVYVPTGPKASAPPPAPSLLDQTYALLANQAPANGGNKSPINPPTAGHTPAAASSSYVPRQPRPPSYQSPPMMTGPLMSPMGPHQFPPGFQPVAPGPSTVVYNRGGDPRLRKTSIESPGVPALPSPTAEGVSSPLSLQSAFQTPNVLPIPRKPDSAPIVQHASTQRFHASFWHDRQMRYELGLLEGALAPGESSYFARFLADDFSNGVKIARLLVFDEVDQSSLQASVRSGATLLEWARPSHVRIPASGFGHRQDWDDARSRLAEKAKVAVTYSEILDANGDSQHYALVMGDPEIVGVSQLSYGLWQPDQIKIALAVFRLPMSADRPPDLPNPIQPQAASLRSNIPAPAPQGDVLESYGLNEHFIKSLSGRTVKQFPADGAGTIDALHNEVARAVQQVTSGNKTIPDHIFVANSRLALATQSTSVGDMLSRRTAIHAVGPSLDLYPSQWSVRRIWEKGGLVTFSPTFLLRSPEKFAAIMNLIRTTDSWAAYVVPEVLKWCDESRLQRGRCPSPEKAFDAFTKSISFDQNLTEISGAAATTTGGLVVSCCPPATHDTVGCEKWLEWLRKASETTTYPDLVEACRGVKSTGFATTTNDKPEADEMDLIDVETAQLDDLVRMRGRAHLVPYRRYILIGEVSLGSKLRERYETEIELVAADDFAAVLSGAV